MRRPVTWSALLVLCTLLLCAIPLFNVLGYAFCLVIGLLISLAGAHLGAWVVAHARHSDDGLQLAPLSGPRAAAALCGRAVALSIAPLALPLLIISLNALRVRNCTPWVGLAFFAMMPLLSATIAAVVGVFWGLLLQRKILATTAAILTVFLSLVWGGYRFYSAPPIFAYDPFAGYFPGTIYDETVALHAPFFAYRLLNLLSLSAAVLLLFCSLDPGSLKLERRRLWRHRGLLIGALLCGTAAIALFSLGGRLGFRIDATTIQRALGGLRRTTHFDIVYPRTMDRAAVDHLAEDHEFRYAQLTRFFHQAPPRITSYIFRSVAEKHALTGAGRTFIAKPWRREIYLQAEAFPHRVLRHELAHVFAAAFGDHLFGVSVRWRRALFLPYPSFNVGLIEGLAVAADVPARGEASTDQWTAALRSLDLAPPVAELMSAGFLTHAGGRAYQVAGSFVRHLIEREGIARFKNLYRSGGDFLATYGKPAAFFFNRWRVAIERVPLPSQLRQLAEERFRRPSIFRRICPHAVANLAQRAAALDGRGDHQDAADVRRQICEFDPGDPLHRLRWLQTLVAANQLDAALALETSTLEHPSLSRPLRRRALALFGDIYWRRNGLGRARARYAAAAAFAAEPGDRRLLALKRWALQQKATLRELLRRYLLSDNARDPRSGARDVALAYRIQAESDRLGKGFYLAAKQLYNAGACHEAIPLTRQAMDRGLESDDMQIEALRLLARCRYRIGDFSGAAAAFKALRDHPHLPPGLRLRAEDWLERVRWRRNKALP